MLSVICPVYNETKYIDVCIQSILSQDYPKEDLEILFVDGMSKDDTRNIIQAYSQKYPFIRLLDNVKKIVPVAMNIGIAKAKGDVIMRLDAHTLYPANYFSVLVRRLHELGADNVGAACRTDVLNKTSKTLAIKEVLSNKFGVGNSTFRLGVNEVQEVDTVPFGCWRREVFDKYGNYDERLIRNQDIELNKRIIRGGGKIFIVPDTYCTYLARETYQELAKNNYGNGKWNILTVYYTKQFSSLSIRHFVPLAFVLSLVLPPLLSLFYSPFIMLTILSVSAYLATVTAISISANQRNGTNIFYLIWAFVVLHLSYGYGSFMGLLKCKWNG